MQTTTTTPAASDLWLAGGFADEDLEEYAAELAAAGLPERDEPFRF